MNEFWALAKAERKNPDVISWYFDKADARGRRERSFIERHDEGALKEPTFNYVQIRLERDPETGKTTEKRYERKLAPEEMTDRWFRFYKTFSEADYKAAAFDGKGSQKASVVSLEAFEEILKEKTEEEEMQGKKQIDPDRNERLGRAIMAEAKLTASQNRRWHQRFIEGRTISSIAHEEGASTSAVRESIFDASKKLRAARIRALDPTDAGLARERAELLRAREACSGCKYYRAEASGEYCARNYKAPENPETGTKEPQGLRFITEAVEEAPGATVHMGEDGRAHIYGLTCKEYSQTGLDLMMRTHWTVGESDYVGNRKNRRKFSE